MARPSIEELDYQMTPLGELILRRREVRSLDGVEVFEVKLDGQFLMSSLVNTTEIALATRVLDGRPGPLDVLVGGLGLGHTATAALDNPGVRSVTVVEYLAPVIAWHERRLVPLAAALVDEPRCTIVHGDFFRFVGAVDDDRVPDTQPAATPARDAAVPSAGRPEAPDRYHAVLVDIDHSPRGLLQPGHAAFYTAEGLRRLRARLHPGGVFALWSAEAPEEAFLETLQTVYVDVASHPLRFYHPLMHEDDVNYIITAQRG